MRAKTLRLLIVDDDEPWRDALKLMFQAWPDVLVHDALSGGDAVDRIKAEAYDLVLLDMRMPTGTEGLDALSEIKRIRPHTPVMMMSAYGDIPKAVEAMKRGALDFLPKEADFKEVTTFKVSEFIRMAHLKADRELLIQAKYQEARRARIAQKKGKALEDLLAALIASIDGFTQIDKNVNTTTEEIDIVFRNGSHDPFWQRQGDLILVECKNWKSQRVGKNEFVVFKEKIENRYGRCKLGFLVCTEVFAETVRQEMLRSSKTDLVVAPVNGGDLRQLVEATNRSEVLIGLVQKALLV